MHEKTLLLGTEHIKTIIQTLFSKLWGKTVIRGVFTYEKHKRAKPHMKMAFNQKVSLINVDQGTKIDHFHIYISRLLALKMEIEFYHHVHRIVKQDHR